MELPGYRGDNGQAELGSDDGLWKPVYGRASRPSVAPERAAANSVLGIGTTVQIPFISPEMIERAQKNDQDANAGTSAGERVHRMMVAEGRRIRRIWTARAQTRREQAAEALAGALARWRPENAAQAGPAGSTADPSPPQGRQPQP